MSSLLTDEILTTRDARLGPVTTRDDIRSSLAPFSALLGARTVYPDAVIEALGLLCAEYNQAFTGLVDANREWASDYQLARPWNFAVQIDMAGLTDAHLIQFETMSVRRVQEALRHRIFEMDNSLAMYQLLEMVFQRGTQPSRFQLGWRATLEAVRRRTHRQIALLAVTQEKYEAMLASEFGLQPDQHPSDKLVCDLTGFDTFMGPSHFRAHVAASGGNCAYALYVRASEPVSKLRRPTSQVDQPLLADAEIRRLIRAHAITLNIDAPGAPRATWINDTKGYMPLMDLGFWITGWDDLSSDDFQQFMASRGFSSDEVQNGQVKLRAKPALASYGAYGHVRGVITDSSFRRDLRAGIRQRGPYIVQPEVTVPVIWNADDPKMGEAGFIDRVYFGLTGTAPRLLSGFRNYMPTGSAEFGAGRIHGSGQALWSEIVAA